MKKILFTSVIAVLITLIAGSQPIPVDPELRMGVLPNGMTYYVRHNAQPKGRAECYLVHKVGSILEDDDERGVAHFLEHIAFNGTTHFPGQTMINYLTSCGMTYGGDINAATGFDQTVYHISSIPTAHPAVLDSVLTVMSDLSCNLAIDSAAVEKEKGIIEEEWRSRNNATVRVYEAALPVLMGPSVYARHIPIGDINFVRNARRADLLEFYHRWFRPDLQAIIVVGDFDADSIEQKVQEVFSSLPAHDGSVTKPADDTDVTARAVAISTDVELPAQAVTLYFPHRKPRPELRNTLAYLRDNLYAQMVAMIINERLSAEALSPASVMQYGACVMGDFLVSTGDCALTLTASPRAGMSYETLNALLTQARNVQEHGVTTGELERARQVLSTSYRRAQAQQAARTHAQYVAEYVDHFVNGGYIPGVEWECNASIACLDDADVDAVSACARELIDFGSVKALIVGSDTISLPRESDVMQLIDRVATLATDAPIDRASSSEPLLTATPQAGMIVSRRVEQATGITVLTLSNGIMVQLKPCKFGNDDVLFNATSPGGYGYCDTDDYSPAEVRLVEQVVENSALGKWNQARLQERLSTTPLSIVYQMSDDREDINGSCHSADIETLLQLNYLYFTAVSPDADAYAALRSRLAAQLQQRRSTPEAAFADSVTTVLYDGAPLYMPLTDLQVDDADFDRVLELYHRRVASASRFTFSIVGDFDPDAIEPLVELYLGSLPAQASALISVRKTPYLLGDRDVVFLRKMQSPVGNVFACLMGDMEYSVRNAILADVAGQVIEVALTAHLRESLQGTYGARVDASLSRTDGKWMIQTDFTTEPGKTQAMVQALAQVIDVMTTYGTTPHLLDVIKEQMLRRHETELSTEAYWLGALRDRAMGVDTHTQYAETISSLTIDEVNAFITTLVPTTRLRVIMQGY